MAANPLSTISNKGCTVSRARPGFKNQSGQIIVETMMLLALVAILSYAITEYFQATKPLQSIIQSPWKNLAGMIENGMWRPVDATTKSLHPNAIDRHYSLAGTTE